MANLEFEEDNFNTTGSRSASRDIIGGSTRSASMKFLLKHGIAKTEKQAVVILLAVAIVCFVSAGLIYYKLSIRKGNLITVDRDEAVGIRAQIEGNRAGQSSE